MEEYFYAVGFYKHDRRYLGCDSRGAPIATADFSQAIRMSKAEAVVAALCLPARFNLAHCRAVSESEAPHVQAV